MPATSWAHQLDTPQQLAVKFLKPKPQAYTGETLSNSVAILELEKSMSLL